MRIAQPKTNVPCFAFQVTVSPDREFAAMEQKLPDLLAVLPESAQYVMIFCTDQDFTQVGKRRLEEVVASTPGRLSRLSVFQMDMRTARDVGAAFAVAPQPSQPAAVPKTSRRKKGSVVDPSQPQPKPANGRRKRSLGEAPAPPDPNQPPQPGVAAISTRLHPALRPLIRPQLPALPRNPPFVATGRMPPCCAGYTRRVF